MKIIKNSVLSIVCFLHLSVLSSLQQIPGTLDPTFGGNGTGFNTIGVPSSLNAIALDIQGRIVAGGFGGVGLDVLIARFNQNGTLDSTFGGNGTGFKLINLGGAFFPDQIYALALDPQGRIVAGGIGGADDDLFIMRFNTDGTLDTTFGGDGTGFNLINLGGFNALYSITIDTQGRIVAGGETGNNALIIRFTPEGIPDLTFGGNGTGFNLIDLGGTDAINSIALDPQGRIVAGGAASPNALIMRLYNQSLTSLTTALREKYSGPVASH
jgi:uncharacterized delta-60 repeat protein